MRIRQLLIFLCMLSAMPVSAQQALYGELLAKKGVTNQYIRDSFLSVDRAAFAPSGSERYIGRDTEIPLPDGGFIIRPSLALSCLSYLSPLPGNRCLVAGNATGYPAALLAGICDEIHVIEESAETIQSQAPVIESFARGIVTVSGMENQDAVFFQGPYDIIMLSSAIEVIPEELLEALSPEGKLLAPIIEPGGFQILILITRKDTGYSIRALNDCFFPRFISSFP